MKPPHDRRSDTRLLCADLIEIIWRDSNGHEKRKIGNLENISTLGLSLQLETSLHSGTRLRIICGEIELSGHVRYVLFRDKAFFVGVQLSHENPWSVDLFTPKHLLDPRTLRYYRTVIPMGEQRGEQKWVN